MRRIEEEKIQELIRHKNINGLVNIIEKRCEYSVHRKVVHALATIGESAPEELITVFGYGSMNASSAAYDALKLIGEPVVKALIKGAAQESSSISDRLLSLSILILHNKGIAVEDFFLRGLTDPDVLIRIGSATFFYKIVVKTPDAIAPLSQCLKDSDNVVRSTAVLALKELGKKLGSSLVTSQLFEALEDQNEPTRGYIVLALAELGDSRIIEELRDMMDFTCEDISREDSIQIQDKKMNMNFEGSSWRLMAIEAAGRLGNPLLEENIVRALDDPDFLVRKKAAVALVEMANRDTIKRFIDIMQGKDPVVRYNAKITIQKNMRKFDILPELSKLGNPEFEPAHSDSFHFSKAMDDNIRECREAMYELGREARQEKKQQILDKVKKFFGFYTKKND